MALKRRTKIKPVFSMASMTDVIFLLLIFFMITSTAVSPNSIKVLLPQGRQQNDAKPLARVIIDKDLNIYAAFGNDREMGKCTYVSQYGLAEAKRMLNELTADAIAQLSRFGDKAGFLCGLAKYIENRNK